MRRFDFCIRLVFRKGIWAGSHTRHYPLRIDLSANGIFNHHIEKRVIENTEPKINIRLCEIRLINDAGKSYEVFNVPMVFNCLLVNPFITAFPFAPIFEQSGFPQSQHLSDR